MRNKYFKVSPYGIYWRGNYSENFNFEKGLEALAEKDKTGEWIYWAGRNWKRFDYEKGLDALIEKDGKGWIFDAGKKWKEFDYEKGIKALKDTEFYKKIFKEWPRGIEITKAITKEIKKSAVKLPKKKLQLEGTDFSNMDSEMIYEAGLHEKNFDFVKGLDTLIKADDGYGDWIYEAGLNWKKFNYKKGIEALKNTNYYNEALKNWPKGIKQADKIIKDLQDKSKKLPKKKLSLEGTELGKIIKRHDKELIIEDFSFDATKAAKMHKHSYEKVKEAYDKKEINLWTYTKILRRRLTITSKDDNKQYYIAIQNLVKELEPNKNKMYSKLVELIKDEYISFGVEKYLRKTDGEQPFPDEVYRDFLIDLIEMHRFTDFYIIRVGEKLLNDKQKEAMGKLAIKRWKMNNFMSSFYEPIKLLKVENLLVKAINDLDATNEKTEKYLYNLLKNVSKFDQLVKNAITKKGREFLRNHKSDLLEPLIEPAKYVDKQTEKIVKGAKKLPGKKLSLKEEVDYDKVDVKDIYKAGCEDKDFDFKKGLDELIEKDEDGEWIYEAGMEWKEFDFKKGLDALIKMKASEIIFVAGDGWRRFDYSKGLKALKGTDFFEDALRDWPKNIKQSREAIKDLQTKSKKLPKKKLSLESALEEIMGDITNQSATTKKSKAYKKARKKFRKNLLAMDYEKEILKEGAEDRGIFKAIFLLGSPGSGKSQIAKTLLQGTAGWKTINPDVMYEYLMKKEKIPIDYKKRTKEQEKRHEEHEITAREKLLKQEEQYLKGRLPIVIDRTGYHYEAVLRHANALKSVGYEVGMIFVDTPQDIALKRNLARKRKLDVEFIKKYDPKIRMIIPHYKKLFGNKFWHVKNIEEITKERKHGELQKIREDIFKWLSKRPDNAKVREWMKTAKEKI